jgi:hypothetical protein
MHPFSALVGRAPRWQPALRWKRHFELRDEGQLYATLSWEKASGALVVARSAEGLWTFERSPRGTPSVQVRSAPDGASLALFQSDWTQGGRLVTSEGHGWLWGACSESRAAWSFRAHGGGARVDVRVDSMGLAPAGRVQFSDGFASDPSAPVLACMGWYLAVMALDDASLLVPAFAAAG